MHQCYLKIRLLIVLLFILTILFPAHGWSQNIDASNNCDNETRIAKVEEKVKSEPKRLEQKIDLIKDSLSLDINRREECLEKDISKVDDMISYTI